MRVLLNRSLARPLVNGESRLIIFGRAIILWCLTLLLPVAAAYYVIVVPLRTQDYARELVQVPTATAVYGTEFVILLQSFALNPVQFAGLTESSHTIFTPQLSSVQPYPQGAAGGNLTSLTLISPYLTATRVLQEIRDADPVSGTSTLGGLWTFVDGVFATFFGANVVYFLLGRRHLSALGVAHIFQRGALTRRWHEDFPKLRTEGGKPGSEDAGIVAFIRQRLIDIDDPKTDDDDDDSLRTPSAMEMTPREGMVDDESEDNLKERLLSSGTPHALGRASTV
ncbi:hypothetical protein FB45DRAFT_1059586 [Roridomyces roridus]|uniref:Uncharacterized protein n=1 Tax=Roridomyces roridus TaxID=1738132 RepID=A0AAD7BSX3_9AGAR|nr:hypothetical protein FB45DRAFT_1059586 [Roridomyces roridus]